MHAALNICREEEGLCDIHTLVSAEASRALLERIHQHADAPVVKVARGPDLVQVFGKLAGELAEVERGEGFVCLGCCICVL